MKKRSLAVLMAGVMAASMMTGVVSVYADADSKTLTVGFDAQYPPFGYKDDNGEYVGFDLDLAQEVCDNLGWELVKKPINWDSKDMELNSGSIDCIWNGFTINGREDDYTWSDPYLNNEQVMVVAADSGIEKLDDLAGKNVVVQAASAALDALNSDDNKDLTASFASLTENPDYNTAFMNLDSGAADAIAVDIGVAKYQLSQREEGKYVILDEPIQSEEYGIGFKKGNDELKDTVWEEVLKLYDAGEVDKLAEKYEVADMLCIGDDEKSDDKKDDAAEDDASDADTAKQICAGCPHYKGMEGTFCAPSFLTVQEKFFRRKAYVFKCNAAAACQWYGSFCRDFCSDITFFTSAGTSDLLWQNVQESGDTWNCVCLHISYAWNPVNAAIDGCVFRTILYFWNPYFHGIQPDRCVYRIQY